MFTETATEMSLYRVPTELKSSDNMAQWPTFSSFENILSTKTKVCQALSL